MAAIDRDTPPAPFDNGRQFNPAMLRHQVTQYSAQVDRPSVGWVVDFCQSSAGATSTMRHFDLVCTRLHDKIDAADHGAHETSASAESWQVWWHRVELDGHCVRKNACTLMVKCAALVADEQGWYAVTIFCWLGWSNSWLLVHKWSLNLRRNKFFSSQNMDSI